MEGREREILSEASLQSPVGLLTLTASGGAITGLSWGVTSSVIAVPSEPDGILAEALQQLSAYFDGRLRVFDLPLHVAGSDYQRAVCAEMSAIPFGRTRTYGELARRIGSSAQAVGNACGANPIPILIPCHRVLGSSDLGGFSGRGGVETKVTLLRHEGAAGLLI
ncbi:MAG: methylated-DNA--[protein]-cysteine S-methyltransferase [Rhodobacteraceae bacterium]|nr:methylated-DNA--[protein]-cysteine S-methyltransferase [Paracoccaceae bacterium]